MADLSIVDSQPLPQQPLSISQSEPLTNTGNSESPSTQTQSKPSAIGRYWDSLLTAINPLPGIREWLNRPAELGHATDALHVLNSVAAENPENKGKPPGKWKTRPLTADEQAIVDRGLNAQIGTAEPDTIPPIAQPAMQAGVQASKGDIAGAAGTLTGGYVVPAAVGAGVSKGVGKISQLVKQKLTPEAMTATTEPSATEWAQQNNIPTNVGIDTDSKPINNIQASIQNAPGGASVAASRLDATRQALTQKGAQIANSITPEEVTPESAGAGIQEGVAERNQNIANAAQDTSNALTQQGTDLAQQVHPQPMTPETAGASTQADLQSLKESQASDARDAYSRLATIENDPQNIQKIDTGKVQSNPDFDSFVSNYTRGKSFADLTPDEQKIAVNMAAKLGIPPAVPIMKDMALPVDMRPVKASLKPIYDQLKEQMPIAQQQASRGLRAISNIVNGDNYTPASTAESNLGAVKAIQREGVNAKTRYLAGQAVDSFMPAVDQAVSGAGQSAADALNQGRALTKAKYATQATIDSLPTEPVQLFNRLVSGDDKSIQLLRDVKSKVPGSMPAVGRAVFQGILDSSQTQGADAALNAWNKIGDSTKQEIFGSNSKAIDDYLKLAKNVKDAGGAPGMEAPATSVPSEPVKAYNQLVQAKDIAINVLNDAYSAAPNKIPAVAKAYVQNLIEQATAPEGKPGPDTAKSSWNKLGDETKKLLYTPQQIYDIDHFLDFSSKAFKNRNPSGSAYIAAATVSLANTLSGLGLLFHDPEVGATMLGGQAAYILGNNALARILFHPGGAKALNAAIQVPLRAIQKTVTVSPVVAATVGAEANRLKPQSPTHRYNVGTGQIEPIQ